MWVSQGRLHERIFFNLIYSVNTNKHYTGCHNITGSLKMTEPHSHYPQGNVYFVVLELGVLKYNDRCDLISCFP